MEKTNLQTFLLVSALFFMGLLSSLSMGLSYDESYYWIYSKSLSFGYYDHPPMVGLLIKMGTAIFGNTAFGVRFFSNILTCISMFLLFKLFDFKKNTPVFILFMSLPLINSSGFLALPDVALLFFATLFFYFLNRYLEKENKLNILFLSVSILGMFYSKYLSILVVIFSVFANLNFLKRKSFWIVVLIVTLGFLPHIGWQYEHDFVSFKYHLFKRGDTGFKLTNLFSFISGQVAIFGILLIYPLAKIGFKTLHEPFDKIMKYNLFGFLLFLLILSFRNKPEANWTITSCVAFIILLTKYYSSRRIFILSLPALLVLFFLKVSLSLNLFSNLNITKRFTEFKPWSNEVKQILEYANGDIIVAENYQHCAKYSFYANKLIPCLHLEGRKSEFSILNLEKDIKKSANVIYITSKPLSESLKIDIGYRGPLYLKKYKFEELLNKYGVDYGQVKQPRY